MQVIARIKGGAQPLRVCRVAQKSVEVDHRIEYTSRPNPVVKPLAHLLLLLAVVTCERCAFQCAFKWRKRSRGHADSPDACCGSQLPVGRCKLVECDRRFVAREWTARPSDIVNAGADRSRYRVNNALAIRETLLLAGGIAICPDWLVRDLLVRGKLVRVLEDWSARPQDLHLVYPSRKYQPLRTKLFIEFAEKWFSTLPGFEQA
jgi:hypothetical protein